MVKLILFMRKLWRWFIHSKIAQYIIFLLLAFGAGKRSAKNKQKTKELETEINNMHKAMEQRYDAEKQSNNLDDTTINKRMRQHGWIRD